MNRAAGLMLALLLAGCASRSQPRDEPPPVVIEPAPRQPIAVRVIPGSTGPLVPADRVTVTVDRDRLPVGASANLVVTVTGIQDLGGSAEIRIINETPRVIRLEGGDDQRVVLAPGDLDATGAFSATIPFQVLARGDYSLRVIGPARRVF